MKTIETRLTRTLEFVLAMSLLAIAAIVVTLVVLRYLFSASITGANELVTILFVYTTAIGAAVAIGRREHIAIGLVIEALPARAQRFAQFVELAAVAIFNSVVFAYSIGWIRITGDYLMPATGLPRMVAQVSVPLGCSLAIVYCFFRLISLASARDDSGDGQAPSHPPDASAE
jgi:TRAP-type C4-dicarboxylate transport system permease small subunit